MQYTEWYAKCTLLAPPFYGFNQKQKIKRSKKKKREKSR
jgi:hypothetical protein